MQISLKTTFHFDADTADRMGRSFDAAWQVLKQCGSVFAQPYKMEETRELIALKMIDLAHSGERNEERLVALALTELKMLSPEREVEPLD